LHTANIIIAVCFALTAIAVYAIGQATGHLGVLMLVVLVSGTLMNTAQSSLPALAAAFYPTHGRATGVAWMLGLGRFGGIAGSFLVAELSRRNLSFTQIFTTVPVPGLISAVALGSSSSLIPRISQHMPWPKVKPSVKRPGHFPNS
jgi:AAHS family 4-hydroxybenzoate transporter-like MFS transporter